jgi:hypothetical protein
LPKEATLPYFQNEEFNYIKQLAVKKQRSPATIGMVQLDSLHQDNQGPFLSAQPSHCFTIPLHLGSQRLKTLVVLNFGAFVCFLDEEFTKLHNIPIVKKLSPDEVFHVFLLEPYKESNISGRTQPPPPCMEIDNHEEYEVEEVLDSRQRRGRLKYLVH